MTEIEYDVMAMADGEWVCVGTFARMQTAVAAVCALQAQGVKARVERFVLEQRA